LREMFQDFSEEEQQHLIGQLMRLGLKLAQATSHHDPERAE
jgi:hypothetical protein